MNDGQLSNNWQYTYYQYYFYYQYHSSSPNELSHLLCPHYLLISICLTLTIKSIKYTEELACSKLQQCASDASVGASYHVYNTTASPNVQLAVAAAYYRLVRYSPLLLD